MPTPAGRRPRQRVGGQDQEEGAGRRKVDRDGRRHGVKIKIGFNWSSAVLEILLGS